MKINCLGCGFKVDLAGAYDDYVGQIKCYACGTIMEIATQQGDVKAVSFVTAVPLPSIEESLERSLGKERVRRELRTRPAEAKLPPAVLGNAAHISKHTDVG
jgi:hypothetical protein